MNKNIDIKQKKEYNGAIQEKRKGMIQCRDTTK